MSRGNAHRKTVIWLGNDDGQASGYNGYGFDVSSEDHMVEITAQLEDDVDGEELQVFILRDLFPAIRAVMDRIDQRFPPGDDDEEETEHTGDYDDLTLLGLAKRAMSYTGHVEDLPEGERLLLLGAFAGAVMRFQQRVSELWDNSEGEQASAILRQVMLLAGLPDEKERQR
jgi:hypothetical protein